MPWQLILEHGANLAEILAGIAIVFSVIKVWPTFSNMTRARRGKDWSGEFDKLRTALKGHYYRGPITTMDEAALAILRCVAGGYQHTDIHIEVKELDGEICGVLRFRPQGVRSTLQEICRYDRAMHPELIASFRAMAELDGHGGRIHLPESGDVRSTDFRIQIAPASVGDVISLRMLDRDSAALGWEALGYAERDLKRLQQALGQRSSGPNGFESEGGLVVFAGPTGSGKTVSLYTSLNSLDHQALRIVTVEDPMEIEIPALTQLAVRDEPGHRMADLFRAAMRMDPDVLLIGEIRDQATADYAIRSAETGSLTLSTMNTTSAIESLERLVRYDSELALPSLLIVNQRLARRLCRYCRIPYEPDAADQELAAQICAESHQDVDDLPRKYATAGPGCEKCQDGYRGRLGGYEVLSVSLPLIDTLQVEGPGAAFAAATAGGMTTIHYNLLESIAQGNCTFAELRRVTGGVYARKEHLRA